MSQLIQSLYGVVLISLVVILSSAQPLAKDVNGLFIGTLYFDKDRISLSSKPPSNIYYVASLGVNALSSM